MHSDLECPPTAQETALSTPELLELILSQLPLRDLLVTAPRVCKLWTAVTLTPTLQRALFFQPDPNGTARRNPLLIAAFPPFFTSDEPSGPGDILRMPWATASDAFRRETASWRRMLVVQPPARTLLILSRHHSPGRTYGTVDLNLDGGGDRDGTGLRMGVLYDVLLQRVEQRGARFRVRWPGYDGVEFGEEVTLRTSDRVHAVPYKSPLGKRFRSVGARDVRVQWNE
ncbi:F-box domain-containing protein [Mycena filopes]|nr:F-box domain-containing protein [Mycena filopes]